MKKITISLIIAVLIIISAIIGGCTDKNDKNTPDGQPDDQEMTYEKNPDVNDPLRIGVPNVNLPPMIIWDENDNLSGFEMDIIAETAKRLGITYEIISVEPGTERELLEDDVIDCAWGNMMDTGKQRLFYNMTDPYITIPQVIVIYDGSEIKDKSDIQNVSVIMSTPAEILTDEDKIDINFKRVSASRDYTKTFEQLVDGYSDAVICDKTVAVYMQNSDGKLKILDEKAAEVKYSVAFPHDDEKMVTAVNKVLKDIFNEGISSELSQKWFEQDYYIK